MTLPTDKSDLGGTGRAPPASQDRATDAPHQAPAGLGPDGSVSTGAALLLEICGHLGAARTQLLPSNDQIIAEHIRASYDLAIILRRAS